MSASRDDGRRDGKHYDDNGDYVGYSEDGKHYDGDHRYVGFTENGKHYDDDHNYVGFTENGKHYDDNHNYIGYTEDGKFYDADGNYQGKVSAAAYMEQKRREKGAADQREQTLKKQQEEREAQKRKWEAQRQEQLARGSGGGGAAVPTGFPGGDFLFFVLLGIVAAVGGVLVIYNKAVTIIFAVCMAALYLPLMNRWLTKRMRKQDDPTGAAGALYAAVTALGKSSLILSVVLALLFLGINASGLADDIPDLVGFIISVAFVVPFWVLSPRFARHFQECASNQEASFVSGTYRMIRKSFTGLYTMCYVLDNMSIYSEFIDGAFMFVIFALSSLLVNFLFTQVGVGIYNKIAGKGAYRV